MLVVVGSSISNRNYTVHLT